MIREVSRVRVVCDVHVVHVRIVFLSFASLVKEKEELDVAHIHFHGEVRSAVVEEANTVVVGAVVERNSH